jgi:hypothetical protein
MMDKETDMEDVSVFRGVMLKLRIRRNGSGSRGSSSKCKGQIWDDDSGPRQA